MALKHTNDEAIEAFLQNENLQQERYIIPKSSSVKSSKTNSSGIKYGLSELSNDKTYLETELPARKRSKLGTEFFSIAKYLNKTCKTDINNEAPNFEDKDKYIGESYNILSNEQEFDNNSKKELVKPCFNVEISTQSATSCTYNSVFQSSILASQFELDSNELIKCNFEKKSENHDFEHTSENVLCKNSAKEQISTQGIGSETKFDDIIIKCQKSLNLDVPSKTLITTTNTDIVNNNLGNKAIENIEINEYGNGSCALNDEDINLKTISLGKKLVQDELNKGKNIEDHAQIKSEDNSILHMINSDSFILPCNENSHNINDGLFDYEVHFCVKGDSLEDNHKNNLTFKVNNIPNDKSKCVKEQNIFFPEIIQTCDTKNIAEHLNLTIEDTLNSDSLKFPIINSQDNLNDEKNEVSSVDDSDDIFILYGESDNDFDETKEEIGKTSISEFAFSEGASKSVTLFQTTLDLDSKTCTNTCNEIEKKDFIFDEKTSPANDRNCESHVLDSIPKNYIENKDDLDTKFDDSFVSEYEISLLVDDTDSIFSVESVDSEYEVSLLEDDIIDEENDSNKKVDSNVGSNCSSNTDGKITAILSPQGHIEESVESIDSEYEVSLLEDDINDEENDSNIGSNYVSNTNKKITATVSTQGHVEEKEREPTTNNINLSGKETNANVFKNKVYSEKISDRNIAPKETVTSNCQKNNNVADSDAKLSVQKKETKKFSESEPNVNTNDKDFRAINGPKIFLKLKKPIRLINEKPDIFKEPSENTNGSLSQLKLEIKKESLPSKKVILNSNKLKNSEGKATNTKEYFKDTTTIVKLEPNVEPKQNINDKFPTSNKVVFNIKMNESTKLEEKVLNSKTNKEIAEHIFSGKNSVKTDLGFSASGESKQYIKDAIPDYYEEEKEDLINPEWNKIKELTTDEERYQQVRDCWKSNNVPNPFKNLTYYSYRKRKINYRLSDNPRARQHKRHASSNLNKKDAKRSRSCTYIFDDRIESAKKEREIETKIIKSKMMDKVKRLNEKQNYDETEVQNLFGYQFEPRRQRQLSFLERNYQHQVLSVTAEYEQQVNDCSSQYASKIVKLKNNRKEILQFYSFYKGLNTNEYKDPTILTNAQILELEEIENIYNQMDHYYR